METLLSSSGFVLNNCTITGEKQDGNHSRYAVNGPVYRVHWPHRGPGTEGGRYTWKSGSENGLLDSPLPSAVYLQTGTMLNMAPPLKEKKSGRKEQETAPCAAALLTLPHAAFFMGNMAFQSFGRYGYV